MVRKDFKPFELPEQQSIARVDCADYIDRFYNHERLHSALDYQSPADFEQTLERAR